MAESGEENDGSKKPQPPPKTRAVAIKSRPSKPAGIKGWGRHRVGVGVPVKKEDDSEGLEAWARIQAERDANRPAVVKPIKRKGWGVAVARIEQFREAKRKERLKKVYLPPDATDEMARQEALAAQKVKEARTDGHEYWDFRAGDGFEEGAGLGKGTGVDGIHVKNWYGEKEEALHVTKEFMGKERKVLKPPEFKRMLPRFYIASTDEAEKCDQVNFKERGITHLLMLGLYRSSQFNKTVQLRIATQDVDTYNMYTHLEKIHAFIDAGRRFGKVLVVDHTGRGECLFVFCAELMRMGFTFDDAERIMRRRVPSGRINYGFVSQLRAYEKLPHVSHRRIPQEVLFEVFPELVPPEAVLSDLGKPLDFQYTRSGDYGNPPEPTSQLEMNAHLGYGTGGGLAEFVDGHTEADALKLLDEETKVEPFSVSPSKSVKSPANAGSSGELKSPTAPVTSPDAKSPQPERRNSVALNKEAEDWVEYFDMNKMKIYYYNTLTGKTRWTMPKELKKLKEDQAAAEAAAKATAAEAAAKPKGAQGKHSAAGGLSTVPEASPLPSDGVPPAVGEAVRRLSKASVDSHATKISQKSQPSAYKSSVKYDSSSAGVPHTQRSKMSAKQLEERRKNKHLIFKYLRLISEFQVSPTSSRISSVNFRDEMVLTTSDFDGNVKFSIWKTGILLSFLRTRVTEPTHRTWCLFATRSKAYGEGTSDWLTVSFSGDVCLWRDPIDTGAKLTTGNKNMPTLIQHMGAITAFDEAPPAHGLSHLCCSAAIRQDRIYILVVTEAGHLLEYTLPQSEIVAKNLVVQPMAGLEGYSLNAIHTGLHFQWDNSGAPMIVPMTRIMYTPDERYIVTGAMDGSVRVWTHVFKEIRAIPAIHEHVRFNEVPLEKCPRPRWKFGAVTALDVSLDSRFVMTGYARGGLVMIWEIDTGKPWMKVIATPEKSVGDTQADRVRQAQRKAKQAARAAAEAKKRMRAKSNPSMARSGSDAFLPSQHTDERSSADDAVSYAISATSSRKTPTVLGADGRPLDDPMSRSNAAFTDLSFSESEGEESQAPTMATAPSIMRKFKGATRDLQADLPDSTKDEGVFNDWPMSTNKEGNYFSIAGVKFSHNQKFIVLATSTGWIQLYSTKSGRLVCQFEVDAEICSICISPNDCFVGVGLNDGRAAVFEIQEQMLLQRSMCTVL